MYLLGSDQAEIPIRINYTFWVLGYLSDPKKGHNLGVGWDSIPFHQIQQKLSFPKCKYFMLFPVKI